MNGDVSVIGCGVRKSFLKNKLAWTIITLTSGSLTYLGYTCLKGIDNMGYVKEVRDQARYKADTDHNGIIEGRELLQMAKGMGLLTEDTPVYISDLEYKIKNAPTEAFERFLKKEGK